MSITEKDKTMADMISEFIQDRRDKKLEDLLKGKPTKNKTGEKTGGINAWLEKLITDNINNDDPGFEDFQKLKKAKKSKDETGLEFQASKYSSYCAILQRLSIEEASSIIDDYQKKYADIQENYSVKNWLDSKSGNASGVSFATHVIKLTHSKIKGATNIFDRSAASNNGYLTTSALERPIIDSALDNAAYADIAELLKLSDHKKLLSEYIATKDTSPLEPHSDDHEQINHWLENLSQSIEGGRLSSHLLAKQVYFPTGESNGYQLLLPIVSSSLAHALHLESAKFFDNESQLIRARRKEKKYAQAADVYYPNKAVVKVTASNHTNASALNGKRAGKLTLVSCEPPVWQHKLHPPKNDKSLFAYRINKNSDQLVNQLQKILLQIKLKKISTSTPSIHREISELIDDIANIVFDYVCAVQNLSDQAGWSTTSTIKKSHKLLLDIHYDNEVFQKERAEKGWQKEIIEDFASWLNSRLKHKKILLGALHERLWCDLFQTKFNTFMAKQEVTL